jgi:hypothetical protein
LDDYYQRKRLFKQFDTDALSNSHNDAKSNYELPGKEDKSILDDTRISVKDLLTPEPKPTNTAS